MSIKHKDYSNRDHRTIRNARSKIKSQKVTSLDLYLFWAFSRFGYLTYDQIRHLTFNGTKSIGKKRIENYLKALWICKDEIEIRGQVYTIYSLTHYGKKQLKSTLNNYIDKETVYQSISPRHDFMHLQYLINHFTINELREFYHSEDELPKSKLGYSRCDGAMIFNDKNKTDVYVETITQHYTSVLKQMKQLYISELNRDVTYLVNKVRV